MLNPEIVDLVERFQTIIVGVFGFAGVIWTIRANARHASKDHKRQLETQRKALRRLVAAELRNYEHALKLNLEVPIYKPDEFISVGRFKRTLSEQLTSDLGLLELGEIDVVVNALISLEGMNHFLENICSNSTETRFLIPAEALDEFQKVSLTTAEALNLAVEVLALSDEA